MSGGYFFDCLKKCNQETRGAGSDLAGASLDATVIAKAKDPERLGRTKCNHKSTWPSASKQFFDCKSGKYKLLIIYRKNSPTIAKVKAVLNISEPFPKPKAGGCCLMTFLAFAPLRYTIP